MSATGNHHGYYISQSEGLSLKRFQYNGADNSLIYAYILKPLAKFMVETFVPRSIAPNTITLFGLFWMITSYFIMWIYCPNLDDGYLSNSRGTEDSGSITFPNWIFFFNGIAMLIYQTLDNMDGVQARTTGSSSPLGLLFDHGCDAFNSVLGSTNWICAMGIGSSINDLWAMAIIVLCPMTLFYISTWEEYHTGKLILPIINGPTEGLILGACQMFISAKYGVAIWHETSVYDQIAPKALPLLPDGITNAIPDAGLRNLDLLLIVTIILGLQESILKLSTVSLKHGFQTLTSIFPILILVLLTICVGSTIPHIVIRNPRLFLNLCSALFIEMATGLMLNHMTQSSFKPLRWPILPMVVLAYFGTSMTQNEQDLFLYSYSVGMFVYLAFKIRIIVHEICSTLGIWCFDIVTPYTGDPAHTTNLNGHDKMH